MGWMTPDWTARRFWEVDAAVLFAAGIRTVFLDLDNTLVPWHTRDLDDRARCWLEEIGRAGMRAVIVSNAKSGRARELAAELDILCVSQAGKPLPGGLRRAARETDAPLSACVMVGDQLFTDLLAARLAGCRAALVEPMDPREMGWTRFMRRVERLAGRRHTWDKEDT